MLGSLLTGDGEWTDVIGYTMIGRKEIENQHVYHFTTVLMKQDLMLNPIEANGLLMK